MTPIHPQHITRALQHARTPEETSALLNALAASPGHLMTLGTSTAGRPIDALVLGSGAPRTVVIGGAHANEPAGTAAVLTLALHLTDSPHLPTGTWYLMPCLDPDGAARNPWRRLPSPTLADYHAAFWRPARAAHPEALLPTDSEPAPLPETAALQRLLDTARPHTLLTLHNSDTGGVFTITTDPDPQLTALQARIAAHHGLPLEPHPADAPDFHPAGPGTWHIPQPPDDARHLHALQYAADRHHAVGLLPEAPLWTTRSGTLSPTLAADRLHAAHRELAPLTTDLPPTDPAADTVQLIHTTAAHWRHHDETPTTTHRDIAHLLPSRAAGLLTHHPNRTARNHAHQLLHRWSTELNKALAPAARPTDQPVRYQAELTIAVTERRAGAARAGSE